jgi:hypothetical protein
LASHPSPPRFLLSLSNVTSSLLAVKYYDLTPRHSPSPTLRAPAGTPPFPEAHMPSSACHRRQRLLGHLLTRPPGAHLCESQLEPLGAPPCTPAPSRGFYFAAFWRAGRRNAPRKMSLPPAQWRATAPTRHGGHVGDEYQRPESETLTLALSG